MNGMFPVLDAEFLYGALCLFRPKRIVEVGSGFSSLVMADANVDVFGGALDITCIEPYPVISFARVWRASRGCYRHAWRKPI